MQHSPLPLRDSQVTIICTRDTCTKSVSSHSIRWRRLSHHQHLTTTKAIRDSCSTSPTLKFRLHINLKSFPNSWMLQICGRTWLIRLTFLLRSIPNRILQNVHHTASPFCLMTASCLCAVSSFKWPYTANTQSGSLSPITISFSVLSALNQ